MVDSTLVALTHLDVKRNGIEERRDDQTSDSIHGQSVPFKGPFCPSY